MAHHKSAIKRSRSNEAKNTRNRAYMSTVRTSIKKLRTAVGKKESAETIKGLLAEAQSLLGRAAKRGLIHKNNASRRVSRLAHLVKGTEQSA